MRLVKCTMVQIIAEFGREKKLNDKSRKSLVHILARFVTDKFGQSQQKIAVSKAAIYLFPSLRVVNSTVGGIVSYI